MVFLRAVASARLSPDRPGNKEVEISKNLANTSGVSAGIQGQTVARSTNISRVHWGCGARRLGRGARVIVTRECGYLCAARRCKGVFGTVFGRQYRYYPTEPCKFPSRNLPGRHECLSTFQPTDTESTDHPRGQFKVHIGGSGMHRTKWRSIFRS